MQSHYQVLLHCSKAHRLNPANLYDELNQIRIINPFYQRDSLEVSFRQACFQTEDSSQGFVEARVRSAWSRRSCLLEYSSAHYQNQKID